MKLTTIFLVFCVALLSDSGEFFWALAFPMEDLPLVPALSWPLLFWLF